MENAGEIVERLVGAISLLSLTIAILAISLIASSLMQIHMVKKYRQKPDGEDINNDFEFNSNRAEKLYKENQLDELVRYTTEVLRYSPNNTDARLYLGVALYTKGEYAAAQGEFERLADMNPHLKETVEPYLEQIREKGSFSHDESTH